MVIPSPRFGIVAQFKNEAMGLREWVDHYRWQGADGILLLNNNSTDDWQTALKGTDDLVEVKDAPKDHAQNYNYITLATHWLKDNNIQMVAILDLDEFLFGTDGKSAKEHLISIFAPNGVRSKVSQVVLPWHVFGSSGHEKQPASIRKAFTKKQAEVKLHVHSEKAVTWFDDLVELDTHRSVIKPGGEVIENPPGLQLNHYYIQSKEFFEKVKLRRGNAGKKELNSMRTLKMFKEHDERSTVEDTLLKQLVEQHEQQRGGGKTRRKRRSKRKPKTRKRNQRGGTGMPDRCLFIEQTGGLGNQLYIYAAGLVVNKKLGLQICTVPKDNAYKHSKRNYSDFLNTVLVQSTSETQARFAAAELVFPKPPHEYSRIIEAEIVNSPSKDKKLPVGYYQNYTTIHTVVPEIREMLFKNEFNKINYKKYQVPSGAAFMHVRRGDYLEMGWKQSEEYYIKALEEMNKHPSVTHIYILSDDLAWCNEQLPKWKEKVQKPLECKDIPDELEALYFMSQCTTGAIISSSTFSTWGVYLGANMNPNSIIIYPKKNAIFPDLVNPWEFPERWIAV